MGISLLIGYVGLVRATPLQEDRCSPMISGRKQREFSHGEWRESAKARQKFQPRYCNLSHSSLKIPSRTGLKQNPCVSGPSVNWIQSLEPGLRGWAINSRGNEQGLRTCGNCAPDQDPRYQSQSKQTREVVLISVRHRNIIQQKKKRCKNAEAQIHTLQRQKLKENLQPCPRINTVVQRCACNSGGFEHHRYGWRG